MIFKIFIDLLSYITIFKNRLNLKLLKNAHKSYSVPKPFKIRKLSKKIRSQSLKHANAHAQNTITGCVHMSMTMHLWYPITHSTQSAHCVHTHAHAHTHTCVQQSTHRQIFTGFFVTILSTLSV